MHIYCNISSHNDIFISNKWENDSWLRSEVHFCKDHMIKLCNIWFISFHIKCSCKNDTSKQNVNECLQFVKTVLKSIIECKQLAKREINSKEFSSVMKHFCDWITSIEEKVEIMISINLCFLIVHQSRWRWQQLTI